MTTGQSLFPHHRTRNDWMPIFDVRDFGQGRHVLVSRAGSWEFVSPDEFAELQGVRISDPLFKRLEHKGLILTGANAPRVYESYRRWTEGCYAGTSLHIVVTTKRCNLGCTYCHATAEAAPPAYALDLSPTIARHIVDFIFQSPAPDLNIEFQGGESLLNFDALRTVVIQAKDRNVVVGRNLRFQLVTNLTALTKEHCAFLREHEIGVATSIDGPPNLHDLQRPTTSGKSSFSGLLKGLELLRDEGLTLPGLLVVFTAASLPHWKEVIDFFVDLGLSQLNVNFVQPLGRAGENWDAVGISSNEHLSTYTRMLDYVFECFRDGHFVRERFLTMALHKLLVGEDVGFLDFRNPCGLAIGQMAYGVDGAIYTCDEGRSTAGFKIGNVQTHSYAEVIDSPQVHQLLAQSLPTYSVCEACAYKAYCVICPVLNKVRLDRGERDPKDPNCAFSKTVFDYAFARIRDDWDLVNAYMINANLAAFSKAVG